MSTRTDDSSPGRDDDLVVRAYRDATRADAIRAEPPRALDDAILAAARRAAGSQPESMDELARRVARARRPSFFRLYQTPLAIAATMVLAVGVAIRVYDSGEANAPAVTREGAAPPPVAAQRDGAGPAQTPAQAGPGVQRPPDLERSVQAVRPPVGAHQRAPEIGTPMSGDQVTALERSRVAKSSGLAEKAEPSATAPSAAPAPEPPPPPAAPAATAAAPVPAAPPIPPPPQADPAQLRDHAVASAPARAAPRAEALEAESFRRAETRAIAPAPGAPAARARVETQERRMQENGALPASIDTLIGHLSTRPPQDWIEQIRALKGRGSDELARQLLAEYRRRFPSAGVPDDLREPQ